MGKKNCVKVLIVAIIFFSFLTFCSYVETTYSKEVVVNRLANGIAIAIDENDYSWYFYNNGFKPGDKIKLIIDNHHTKNISDDTIKKVHKIQ